MSSLEIYMATDVYCLLVSFISCNALIYTAQRACSLIALLKLISLLGCLITHVNDDASLSYRVRQVSSWLPPLHLLVHYYPKYIQQLERILHQNSKKKHSVKMQFHIQVTYRKQTIKFVYRMTLSAYIANGTNCMLTKNCPLPTPFQNAPSKNCPLPTPFQNAPSKNSNFFYFLFLK